MQKKQGQKQKQQQPQGNPLLNPKWKQRTHDTHKKHLEDYSEKEFKVTFLGDSMMERWKYTKYWEKDFANHANLGVGGDGIEHLLYRISGENNVTSSLDVIKTDKIVFMIGTNNAERRKVPQICEGIEKALNIVLAKQPAAEVIVYNITYRKDVPDDKIKEINDWLEDYIKKSNNPKLSYRCLQTTKADLVDNVHLNEDGYRKWFEDMKIVIEKC